jgi:hypothetical protein
VAVSIAIIAGRVLISSNVGLRQIIARFRKVHIRNQALSLPPPEFDQSFMETTA